MNAIKVGWLGFTCTLSMQIAAIYHACQGLKFISEADCN